MNEMALHSDLFVFADGAKSERDHAGVAAVREFIRTIDGFRSVTLIERDCNLGLSRSVIEGVTRLCDEYGRAIAVEDDVITSPDFLPFMNDALERYENEPNAFSICAFTPPIVASGSYKYDAFWSYRFACWGWGTWRDRWERADWLVRDYPEFAADRRKQMRFNRGGEDLSWFLSLHMEGRIDSWDTIWAYTHHKHDAMALLPVISKAYNIGFDGSGTHCRRASFKQHSLTTVGDAKYRLPEAGDAHPHFVSEIQRFHRPSLAARIARLVRRIAPRKKRFHVVAVPKN